MRRTFVIVTVTAMIAACSHRESPQNASEPAGPAGFVDRVWTVVESPGGPGELYVFLSDGTFVRAAKEAKPEVGKWSWDGKRLTYSQYAVPYEADIDSLTDSYLGLTVHFMNQSVFIGLAPAPAAMPDTTRKVEFDPAQSSINIHGTRQNWLLSVESDRARLRMGRRTVEFARGEWVQECAAVWDYTAYADDVSIDLQLSTSTCVDSSSGAEYPLSAVMSWDGRTYHGCAVAGKLPGANY